MNTRPLALSPAVPSELLSYILTHQSSPTTLIICQPSATFLASLLRCVPHVSPPTRHAPAPPPPRPPGYDQDDIDLDEAEETDIGSGRADGDTRQDTERHHLLIPTLHQIATSRNINIIYTPSVSHLRAYLSVFPIKDPDPQEGTQTFTKAGTKTPLLVIYGLLESHRHTSEWSAQGLGITLAALVDTGDRVGRKVVLFEELDGAVEREDGGTARKENLRRVWEEQLPILNGSVKRAGIESEDGSWSGRTVEVGRVLSRWFRFEGADWDEH